MSILENFYKKQAVDINFPQYLPEGLDFEILNGHAPIRDIWDRWNNFIQRGLIYSQWFDPGEQVIISNKPLNEKQIIQILGGPALEDFEF